MAVAKMKTSFTESEMTEFREIGGKLMKARESAGLTQTELANRVGADRATISHYENGTGGYMGGAMLYRLCSELGIEPNDLSPSRLLKESGTEKETEKETEKGNINSIDALLAKIPQAQRELLMPGLIAMLGTYL